MIENAEQAIALPEVQDLIRHLSDYGLGVFLPHTHPDGGGFAPLPPDLVQVERDRRVSFVNSTNSSLQGAFPVAWRWDGEQARVTASCYCCKAH